MQKLRKLMTAVVLLWGASLTSAQYHDVSGYPRQRNGQESPITIDEISIELGGGPDGYHANFRDITARGLSNLTVTSVNTDLNRLRFKLSFYIPKIWARAKYRSSGTLLMVKASGGGDYWGEYEGVRAAMVFAADREARDGGEYLKVRDLDMNFSVDNIHMGIENLQNANPVIGAAMNLFINANAKELLHEMKPALRVKLAALMRRFVESQFIDVPLDQWVKGLRTVASPQAPSPSPSTKPEIPEVSAIPVQQWQQNGNQVPVVLAPSQWAQADSGSNIQVVPTKWASVDSVKSQVGQQSWGGAQKEASEEEHQNQRD